MKSGRPRGIVQLEGETRNMNHGFISIALPGIALESGYRDSSRTRFIFNLAIAHESEYTLSFYSYS